MFIHMTLIPSSYLSIKHEVESVLKPTCCNVIGPEAVTSFQQDLTYYLKTFDVQHKNKFWSAIPKHQNLKHYNHDCVRCNIHGSWKELAASARQRSTSGSQGRNWCLPPPSPPRGTLETWHTETSTHIAVHWKTFEAHPSETAPMNHCEQHRHNWHKLREIWAKWKW